MADIVSDTTDNRLPAIRAAVHSLPNGRTLARMSEVATGPGGEIVPDQGGLGDLSRFETAVRSELERAGLPSSGVFVDVAERAVMIQNVGGVLAPLSAEVRGRSFYISKMIAAASVGLFDAALNYLWDELVNELRRRVAGFDLNYFFDVAVGSSDLRKSLKSEDDLKRLNDQNLLEASREIGLISDVGFQRLDHVRYMRNHASAAHPNQSTLTGLDLAQWMQVCIREVITTPPDTVTANTKVLLAHVREARLDSDAVRDAAVFFDQLPPDRAVTLANGLFGLYTAPNRTPVIADNVRTLWPKLWPFLSEDARHGFGVRHARARASADTEVATAARELLDLVDGAAYLNADVRAAEISEALDALMDAHQSWNNFANEISPARRLAALAGVEGDIPRPVREQYVNTLVRTFLGNRSGIAWAAAEVYQSLLEQLDSDAASRMLRSFMDPDVASRLDSQTGRKQWATLLDIVERKLTSTTDRALLDDVRAFTGQPHQLRVDTAIARKATAPQD